MAVKAFGVSVSVDSNTIGGLRSVTIPESDSTDIDVTTHSSTSGYKEYIGGLKDGGTVTLEGVYLPADTGQAALADPTSQGGDPVGVVVTFSDSSTASFNAVVKGYGVTNPLDDTVTFNASLKVSGPITFDTGV